MVTLTIDGKTVQAEQGSYVLASARALGIDIPSVCAHGAVEPFSACRLCMVEIRKKGWDADWTKLVASCAYPVEEGLEVFTSTDRVIKVRRMLLELLLARCPESEAVKEWAQRYGVETTRFQERARPDLCILCNTCTRVCEKLGASAICASQRGKTKRVGPPFGDKPSDCIGCLACALNCPTGQIRYEDGPERRKIWGKTFELQKCPECGKAHITKEQTEFYVERHGLPEEHFLTCDACKNKKAAEVFSELMA